MKKYKIIYADPPWHYNDKRIHGGGALEHYPLMKTEEIQQLPISSLASKDSMLFLWATFPNLREALSVIEAWGFTYKTLGFAWIKTNKRQNLDQYSFLPTDQIDYCFGIGHYTKSNCEVCLLAVRGEGAKLVKSNSVYSTVISPRQEHSRKPSEVRNRIVELVGDIPRVELFAREQVDGWDVWGNEVESDIDLGTKEV